MILRLVIVAASLVVIGLLVHANTLVGSSRNAHLSALRAGGPSAIGSSTAAAATSESPQAAAAAASESPQLGAAQHSQPAKASHVTATSEPAQHATPPLAAATPHAEAAPQGCPPTRKPYHVVMTAATGIYQEWQSRIAYYHYLKQKKAGGPCSDIGGFTRLFNSPSAAPDKLMDEIPTLVVKQLGHGSCDECDHGFIVMNRPWGAVQFVETEHFRNIPEEYLFFIETDHMMMRPPLNGATPEKPVGFGFYYMISTDPKLKPVVQKFLDPAIDIRTVDNVGPSPLLVHKAMLKRVARPWWDLSVKMKHDSDANHIFGWVLEMWGYNLAARNLGIRHTVSQSIQVEPQGIGTDDMADKDIYHYTFGLSLPGGWRVDKRQYYGGYPADHLRSPPACSARSAQIITNLWTEAAQQISNWPRRVEPIAEDPHAGSPFAKLLQLPVAERGGVSDLLVGTGPWAWGRLKALYFFSRGVAYINNGDGPRSADAHNVGRGSWREQPDGSVRLTMCGRVYRLAFADPAAPWSFAARLEGTAPGGTAAEAEPGPAASGSLSAASQRAAQLHPLDPTLHAAGFGAGLEAAGEAGEAGGANVSLVEELAGSGPWSWAGMFPLGFMRGGQLVTPWGDGTWGVTRSSGSEVAPAGAVFADFANSFHTVRLKDRHCLKLESTRKVDGEHVSVEFGPPAEFDGRDEGRECKSWFSRAVEAGAAPP